MDIGFLVDTLSVEKGSGIARYSKNLIDGLERSGHNVNCIFPNAPDEPVAGIYGHAIKLPYKILCKRNDFDIFHASAPVTGLGLLLTKKPKVVMYHDLASILYQPEAKPHVKAFAPYFYKIGRYCDKIICNSTQTRQELTGYLKLPESKIAVINLGVDDKFYPVQTDKKDTFVIGYIGSISPRKRVDYLINAFNLLKKDHPGLKARLIICGKRNPYHELIQKMVRDLGLTSDVEFRNYIPDDQLNQTYNSFDLLVIPSEWEGFGIPILEAQRCGKPVIIRENVHIPDEVTKCCVKCKSEKDMADKIFDMASDQKLYKSVSGAGIDYSNRFTWDKMVEETIKVYNEIL
jgi:glycosyltransferase involved in cell wall biosynthesis